MKEMRSGDGASAADPERFPAGEFQDLRPHPAVSQIQFGAAFGREARHRECGVLRDFEDRFPGVELDLEKGVVPRPDEVTRENGQTDDVVDPGIVGDVASTAQDRNLRPLREQDDAEGLAGKVPGGLGRRRSGRQKDNRRPCGAAADVRVSHVYNLNRLIESCKKRTYIFPNHGPGPQRNQDRLHG